MVIMQLAESVMRLGGAEARRARKKSHPSYNPCPRRSWLCWYLPPLRTNGQNKYSLLFAIVTNIVYLCH